VKSIARQARYAVPGLERGLRILQLFDREQTRLTAPEMAKALRIPRSTVFRLLQTLERLGFLEREEKTYRLGPAVLRLGFEYLASLEITDLARPSVEALRDDTGFSAQLVIRDGRDVVVVLKAAASSAFASSVNVGTRLPAHATILGRVLMCDLSESDLREIFSEPRLAGFSSSTPKSVSELAALVREDRARGYAVSESFFEQSVSAIAAPIRDHSGRVAAAVGLTLQQSSIEPKALRERLIKRVLRASAEISHRLNYRPVPAAA
jgi:DNA-binding IclR family transcriptional regulator